MPPKIPDLPDWADDSTTDEHAYYAQAKIAGLCIAACTGFIVCAGLVALVRWWV